jgi:hypothetical protein
MINPAVAAIKVSRASRHVLFDSSHKVSAMPATAITGPAGIKNAAVGEPALLRSTGSAIQVTK